MSGSPAPAEITRLLQEWQGGNREALDRLIPLVYQELHTLASRQLAREWRHDRLQTTAVVSEAYVKLFGQREVDWQNRGHFFAIAAQLMRRILVDHARASRARKRGGGAAKVTFDEVLAISNEPRQDFVALDDALEALARFDERKSRVVELRFFGGLTVEETASVVAVSPETVMRDWQLAKVWLRREMRADRPR